MSYRCTGAFLFADRVYSGGQQVEDDDPILRTHAEYFTKVDELTRAAETASAAPGEVRHAPVKKAPPAKKAPATAPVSKTDKPEGDN